jgi:hypothetical protein
MRRPTLGDAGAEPGRITRIAVTYTVDTPTGRATPSSQG